MKRRVTTDTRPEDVRDVRGCGRAAGNRSARHWPVVAVRQRDKFVQSWAGVQRPLARHPRLPAVAPEGRFTMSDTTHYVRLAVALRELAERYAHGQRTGESDRQVVLFHSAARACDTLVATLTCLRAEEAAHAQAQRERDEARQRADTFRALAQDARCCMVELLELVERYLPSGNEGPLIRRWLVRLGAELRGAVAS